MKNRMLLPLLLAGLASACVQSFVSVSVPIKEKPAVDFFKYQDVYFIDFITQIPENTLAADAEIKRIFVDEFSFIAGKKVSHLEPAHWRMIRDLLRRYRLAVDIRYENSVFFQEVFRSHPRALFFTGKLNLDIKKMGVVKEASAEKGEKKNVYTSVQLWEMELKVSIIDGDAGQVLLQETYTEKLEPGELTSAQFNFNSMLAKMTAKLAAALTPRKMIQERFIILK